MIPSSLLKKSVKKAKMKNNYLVMSTNEHRKANFPWIRTDKSGKMKNIVLELSRSASACPATAVWPIRI
jgi:hypothetical protein